MKTAPIIEKNINDIWKNFSKENFSSVHPLAVSNIPKCDIIFIGLNPSLNESDKSRFIYEDKKLRYYTLNTTEAKHPYFSKFIDIALKTNLKWGHLDLLYIQETSQKEIEKLIRNQKGCDFIYQQLMITKELILKIIDTQKPLVFIVCNTLAREFLGKNKNETTGIWMNFDFRMNDKLGTYTYKNIPFFFSSMLSGQRALDLGSYERLIWHINYTKNSLRKK